MELLRGAFEKHHSHSGVVDNEQLSVIFSPAHYLIVEAPAGYGKTKTMISKIAYLLLSDQIATTKHVLALTFSVYAAYKIRKEIQEQANQIVKDKFVLKKLERRVDASNYHGFCRRLLGLYGYSIAPEFTNVSLFSCVDESRKIELNSLPFPLDQKDKDFLYKFAVNLKNVGKPGISSSEIIKKLQSNKESYLQLLQDNFILNGYITYNGILLFAQKLFNMYPEILHFYQSYYPAIFVDEFQDTNWLQWELLKTIVGTGDEVSSNSFLYLFGDSVQRIYGFIGAIPDIFNHARDKYGMGIEQLVTNHRFRPDTMLGRIDRILRANAENPRSPQLGGISINIPISRHKNQLAEAIHVANRIKVVQETSPDSTIAVLVRAGIGSNNTKAIYNSLNAANINFFYALFRDEDSEYIEFHKTCLVAWTKEISKGTIRSFRAAQSYINEFTNSLPKSETNDSLIKLLKYHMIKVQGECSFLSFEEKARLVSDTLANRALKQHLDLIRDTNVIFATIHGAKGLEWDYVILPDLERFAFPPYLCSCQECNTFGCPVYWQERSIRFEADFLDELSVFYVAVTRARNDVFLSYSLKRFNKRGGENQTRLSCLAKLPGIAVTKM